MYESLRGALALGTAPHGGARLLLGLARESLEGLDLHSSAQDEDDLLRGPREGLTGDILSCPARKGQIVGTWGQALESTQPQELVPDRRLQLVEEVQGDCTTFEQRVNKRGVEGAISLLAQVLLAQDSELARWEERQGAQ